MTPWGAVITGSQRSHTSLKKDVLIPYGDIVLVPIVQMDMLGLRGSGFSSSLSGCQIWSGNSAAKVYVLQDSTALGGLDLRAVLVSPQVLIFGCAPGPKA